ncbi:hypothetical protein ACEWY4_023366 [Coilia grayii]|uniref:CASP8 and FADD-like apoptosis regulator n=1 Tax=Coilia grayii TaxID=363190 RepID=A0ABD1J6D0_9TELE
MTPQLTQTINNIAESLSFAECKKLLYLSGVDEVHSRTSDIRDVLSDKCMSNVKDMDLLLMELMFRMRRYDILKKILRSSRTEVEVMLKRIQFVSDYRVLMVDISENIGAEDLSSIKFLLSNSLSREIQDGIKSFLDIVTKLEKQGEVSSENMDLIEQCLRGVNRIDLVKKINQYKKKVATTKGIPAANQTSVGQLLKKSTPESSFNPVVSTKTWELIHKNTNISTTTNEIRHYQCSVDVYRMQAQPRGVCVIIDCVGNDGERLEQTFKSLHFHVMLRKLLTVTECLSTLREVAELSHHRSADAFACCIISRASGGQLLGTEPQGPGLSLDAVRDLFHSDACPALAGKPKLFFVHSYNVCEPHRASSGCSGYHSYWNPYLDTDRPTLAHEDSCLPTTADVFWSHCWTRESALQEPHHQSVYLQALQSSLLNGQRRKRNFLDIHMEVNQKIFEHSERNPTETYSLDLRHTLRKIIFLS